MDIRDILKSFDSLSEATTTTDKGVTTHKGDYGREFDTDDEGNPVVKKVKSTEPKPKGRRPDPDKPKTGKDDPKNKKVGDLFGRTTGAVPKGKKGAQYTPMADADKEEKKKEKAEKKGLKEYFDQMDEALYEAALAVQPLPATPQQKQQQQMAGKPAFMIKSTKPGMPAITTQNPAVVDAAKNGTMTMQEPGAAPTAPGATPAAGAGSQVKPMGEAGGIPNAKSHGVTPAQFREKMKAHKSHGMMEAGSGALDWKSMITPNASVGELRDMFEKYDLPRSIADFLEYAKDARNLGQAMQYFDKKSLEDEEYGNRVDREYGGNVSSGYYQLQDLMSEQLEEAVKAFSTSDYDRGLSMPNLTRPTDPVGRNKLAATVKQNRQANPGMRGAMSGQSKPQDGEGEARISSNSNVREAEQPPHFAQSSPLSMAEDKSDAESDYREALATQIYDLSMLIHNSDRMYASDSPQDNAKLKRLQALWAQYYPGQDAVKIGSALSKSQQRPQQSQQAAPKPQGIMQKAKNAISGMFEGGVAKQGFVILDPKLMAQIEPMDATEVEDDVVWSTNPNVTAKLMAFAKANPHRLKISSSMSDTGGARPVGNQWNPAAGPELVEGKKGVNPFAKKDDKTAKKDDKAEKIGKEVTKDIEKKGAAPKKGVNPFAKKTEKKKVKEGKEQYLQAARLEGKSHALRKMPYNCTHDDMEEARHYHDGFKEGLDECYGQMPILGRTAVGEMGQGPEVDTMASYGADELGEMDKTSYMKQQAIKTPGDTFKAFGQTMRDSNVLDEFAFEALDKQLNAILEGKEVSEGMTVSISKGQQGAPDSVSVSAQDGEADQLLSIIKSAGMGLFGGNEQNGYGAPQGSAGAHGGISVVDDHDGMMALMRKLSGAGDEMPSGGDYESEEGQAEEDHMHGEEETCNECGGMMEENHQCGSQEMVDEETPDQEEFEVVENAPDSGADNTNADVAGNASANSALATADAGADEEEGQVYSSPTEGKEDTTGEEAGKEELDEGTCKKCDCKPCKCETMSESSFFNLFRKISMLSEESTEKEDDKAEEAGEEVKKDIEYDDKKDKKDKKLDEWANEAGKNGTDASFEADIDFMTKVISGGLNKQKSTGQTTIPVINGQKSRMGVDGLGSPMKESNDLLKDYRKLSGL